MGVAAVILDVLSLVQAGLELKFIADKVKAMEAQGATPEQITAYLANLKTAVLADLDAVK